MISMAFEIMNHPFLLSINHSNLRESPLQRIFYQKGFNHVMRNIRHGNSFLTNLTFATRVYSDLELKDIFLFKQGLFQTLDR